ncbi:MAG: RNA methyltransferase [Nanoarchaeota archaeon]
MITVVLVEPSTPGNIGAIARVMKNFGFSQLLLVNPRCDHLTGEAMARAMHAADVLKKARKVSWSAVKKFPCVVGTTAKMGSEYNILRAPLSPAELAESLPKVKTALVFGREDTGLTNEEVMDCDIVCTIPSQSKYTALNLSHAAAILLYELRSRKKVIGEQVVYASAAEKKVMLQKVDAALRKMDFSSPRLRETQRKVWKRVVGKSFLTKREAFALMGFLRKIR